jgi:hypothetical protein
VICRRCDRGNRYCSSRCAEIARLESIRRARARYQKSAAGRVLHCAAQRRHRRQRRQKGVRGEPGREQGKAERDGEERHREAGAAHQCWLGHPQTSQAESEKLSPGGESAEGGFLAPVEPAGPAFRHAGTPIADRQPVRKSSVTDHGSLSGTSNGIVKATAAERRSRGLEVNEIAIGVQCDMCGTWCSAFVRRRPWHRGRRWTEAQGGHP